MSRLSPRTLPVLLSLTLPVLSAASSQAALFSFTVSGTVSANTTGDDTIPVGTPWTFELIYDTAAPDLDPDPTFGRFTNTGPPPALNFFHFQAGAYEVTIDDPADFGEFSDILVTFTSVHAIDINIFAPAAFPPLAGGDVSFHADFNDFSSRPIFESDALPTSPDLDPGSFDESTVTLLPPNSEVSSSDLTSLAVTPVPEPSSSALAIASLLVVVGLTGRRSTAHS